MTKKMTLTEARKSFNGKAVRAFGKHTGTVERVERKLGDRRLIFFVKYEDGDAKLGGMAFENEIEVRQEIILGYTLTVDEILKHVAK